MNTPRTFRTAILICILCCQIPSIAQHLPAPSTNWQVYFSPRGGAASAIIQSLHNAKALVLVQAYSFTSTPIAEALVRAHNRGVRVQVLLAKSQRTQRYTAADVLDQAGIRTHIDAAHAIAHNKVMVIDSEIVITGSFNFSKAAEERNAENLLIIRNKELAARYIENWWIHQRHSSPCSQPRPQK
jgi:phosphatidylserine/phosphatidylglycerophosphate/cardiolipin synthase-like enzyme